MKIMQNFLAGTEVGRLFVMERAHYQYSDPYPETKHPFLNIESDMPMI